MNMVKHVIFFTHPGFLRNIYLGHLFTYIFRLLHGRYWVPRLRFLETASRALQDLLYTFLRRKNKINQIILISHFVIFS